MPVTAALQLTMTVDEVLATTTTASAPTIRHSVQNVSKSFTGATSPAATKFAGGEYPMSAGALTLNLAALTKSTGGTEDFTGLKVQGFLFKNKSTNANDITMVVGASNGFDLMGATMNIVLKPGQSILFDGNDATADVASGDRTIDFSGTAAQVVIVEVLAG